MAAVPEPLHTTAAAIYRAYENDADSGNRPHLGASLIGHACERFLWLTFRWADDKKFDGRMLRLFETGQLEEARLVRNLRRIGVEVHEAGPDGKQWRISDLGGHFAGSMDGAGVGFPEAPKAWHVLEFKTHNDKSFTALVKDKVQKAKPMHYAQMQAYMGYTGMTRAMYMAVNKNTDDVYCERVEFDQVEFAKLKGRAERVIRSPEPPLRCSNDPSWYTCKMCDFHSHCHGEAAPQVNCRTCAHSTPIVHGEDGQWLCERYSQPIPLEAQREGCHHHRYIPILLERFATMKDVLDGGAVQYETETGTFINGDPDTGALSSQEIRACEQKVMLADACRVKTELVGQGFKGARVAR